MRRERLGKIAHQMGMKNSELMQYIKKHYPDEKLPTINEMKTTIYSDIFSHHWPLLCEAAQVKGWEVIALIDKLIYCLGNKIAFVQFGISISPCPTKEDILSILDEFKNDGIDIPDTELEFAD